MARATVCIECGVPTFNGTRCVDCNRGFRRAARNPAYDQPEYRRLRARKVAEHRATFGARCPRCGRPESRSDRSTWLTLNHTHPLALGGDILGATEVICLGCNDRQRHADMPLRPA